MKTVWLFVSLLSALCVFVPRSAVAQDDYIDIEVGKSTYHQFGPATVIATDPDVVVVKDAGNGRFQFAGKSVGSTDVVVYRKGGAQPIFLEINVHRDLSDLVRRIEAIVEGEPPSVYPLADHIVVQGAVDDLDTLEQVAMVASVFDPEFVNLMSVRGDHQVQLEVVFAETSRTGFREIGINAMLGDVQDPTTSPWQSGAVVANDGPIAPAQNVAGLPFPVGAGATGAFDLIAFIPDITGALDIAAIFSITDTFRLSKVLSQPTLVVLSGQQGEFLVGGEVPIPTVSPLGQITVQLKPYGIRVSVVPTVLAGDVIDLRVVVENSDIDQTERVNFSDVLEVPAFLVQKSRSHIRVPSGMTFAMAGLLQETTAFSRSQIPLLGDLPIVGTLFRYARHQREERELMIFVTPRLVRPLGPNEVPAPPGTAENNNTTDIEFYLFGLATRPGSRTAEPAGRVGLQR